jgi:adenylate cyclase class 2
VQLPSPQVWQNVYSAEMPQEIEVKCMVPSTSDATAAHLVGRGAFWSAPFVQDDQAYAERGWSFDQSKLGFTFARIRTVDGHHTLTLKVPQANSLACLEYETGVDDAPQTDAMLEAMGYRPTVRIRKRRRTARFGDITLCLDEVDGLGLFMEAETMTSAGEDGAAIQGGLRAWLEAFALPITWVEDGYDTLMAAHLEVAASAQ